MSHQFAKLSNSKFVRVGVFLNSVKLSVVTAIFFKVRDNKLGKDNLDITSSNTKVSDTRLLHEAQQVPIV